MKQQLIAINDLPDTIITRCWYLFDDWYSDISKLTHSDVYDIDEIIGDILKAIEYIDEINTLLPEYIHDIMLLYLDSYDYMDDDSTADYIVYRDATLFGEAINNLAEGFIDIFKHPYMRGVNGRLNYYIDEIIRENTIVFRIRNHVRPPRLPSPSNFEERLLDISN